MNRFANKIIVLLLVVSLFSVIGCESTCPLKKKCKAEWQCLFDGKTLNGWKKIGGEGQFYVEDGTIVGRSVPSGQVSTFLCTEKNYGDFVLEYEAIIDEELNSGVQIRSHILEEDITTPYLGGNLKKSTRTFKAGIVWGYQIEIDPTERAWSGGLYEEGGRGWLQHLDGREAAKKAFKNGQWNHFRVKAIGDSFKTWVNEVPVVVAKDSRTACGFIGLQLHYPWRDEQTGKTVRWRNIRIKVLD